MGRYKLEARYKETQLLVVRTYWAYACEFVKISLHGGYEAS